MFSVRIELKDEEIVRFDVASALVEFDVVSVLVEFDVVSVLVEFKTADVITIETSPDVDDAIIGGDIVAVEFTACVVELVIELKFC